ncbi:LOW QUALITY PROTEIN: mitochondrial enolase superfamily member 1 [Leptosomus discolor]
MQKHGYMACTRSCAWLGYSDQQLKQMQCGRVIWRCIIDVTSLAVTHIGLERRLDNMQFKVKVGADLQDDICKCRFIEIISPDKNTMLDANQQWEITEAIEWVTKPAEFKPSWTKEPTFPDEDMHDWMGRATISKALALLGIGVATREHCHNRVIFKQLLPAKALSYLQIDSCRLGSVNENLSALLMAKNFQSKALQNAAAIQKWFSPR